MELNIRAQPGDPTFPRKGQKKKDLNVGIWILHNDSADSIFSLHIFPLASYAFKFRENLGKQTRH